MQSTDRAHALCVLVVSEDRRLTRELSRFLNMAGYRTLEAAHSQVAVRAVDTGAPHVALLDARVASRDRWSLCRRLYEGQTPGGLAKFLLVHEPDDVQLREALDAGVDDVFVMPLCYGELLARLRTAARVLEYDRRAGQQELIDSATGLPSRAAFVARLQHEWSSTGGPAPRVACVVVDLDFFSALGESAVLPGAATLLASVAEDLRQLCGHAGMVACLGHDRFAVMLADADIEGACQSAERIRATLSEKSGSAEQPTFQITASCGVATSDTARSADELLEQAETALAGAKTSGRNCIVRWGEFADESPEGSTWSKLLDRTVTSDVLTPCPVLLQPSDPLGHAAELFRQTHLEAIPVVDVGGKLLGLCKNEHVAGHSADDRSARTVGDVMMADVRRFGRHEDFSTLMEFFNDDPLAWAVVVHDGRPVGLLNCDSILGLSQPVGPFDATREPQFTNSTEYLLVPDVVAEKWDEPA